jgi:N-acetylmuramoyl-L-alanine amidase
MDRQPPRDRETRELIRRYETRQSRRRRLRRTLAILGGAVFVAFVVTAIVLIMRGGEGSGDTAVVSFDGATVSMADVDTTSSTGETADPATGSTTTDEIGTSTSADAEPTTTTTATPTTSSPPAATSTTTPTTSTTAQPQPEGLVVVIDPGHQGKANTSLEPIGPGSDEQKAKVSSGTAGVATGVPESELVLGIALKLRDVLESEGIQVIMTRTTQDVDISNIERAQIANAAGADLFVRIHADGNSNSAVHGIHVLYPASIAGWTDDIAEASKRAASLAQQALIAATGAKDRGIDARDDMTGFNWSDVPVILPEIGFMTNPDEDRLLATAAYQDKIVQALADAILSYLGVS